MADILERLNDRQLQAVTAPEKSVLILAGAGSGKTRVLTTRIAWLLEQGRCRTSEILAVTFTNKAAKEMLARLETMLPYDLHNMWVGTFHGLCNRILRRHAEAAGLPKTFQILDSGDQLSLIKRIMKEQNIDAERTDARKLQSFINWQKEHGVRSWSGSLANELTENVSVFRAYEAACQREGVVDFAELLLRCYELLDRNEIVRSHYQGRFRHILVDEFQDTNILQYRWLQILAGLGRGTEPGSMNAVFAVGDDDQSIYAFRGANVGNMADFVRDFATGEPIRLEQNYRSTGTILAAANAIISHNQDRLGKNLWTSGKDGEKIVLKEFDDDAAEARDVQREIMSARSRGDNYADCAVLYRMNAQSRILEQTFTNAGIPFRIYGGQRFFERAEVKHVLAYMRLLDNPTDDTSFLRVVNFPTRGIGAKTIDNLTLEARAMQTSLWGALTMENRPMPPKLVAFRELIDSLREKAAGKTLSEVVRIVIRGSGLEAHYQKERDGEDRIANMNEIMSAADGYCQNEGVSIDVDALAPFNDDGLTPLQGFLSQATLEAGDKNETQDVDAVQMMTVHAAKGLEFANVFIVGLEQGIFPHFSAVRNDSGDMKGLAEERRLMYVAVTRAKKRLFLSHCDNRRINGEFRRNDQSEFIEEIPESLIWDRRTRERNEYIRERTSDYGWEQPSFGGSRGRERYERSYGGRSYGRDSYGDDGYGRSSYGRDSYGRDRYGSGRSGGRSSYGSGSSYGSSSSQSSGSRTPRYVDKETLQKMRSEQEGSDIRIGTRLRHNTFGEGIVQDIAGDRVTVEFEEVGQKILLWTFARNHSKILD